MPNDGPAVTAEPEVALETTRIAAPLTRRTAESVGGLASFPLAKMSEGEFDVFLGNAKLHASRMRKVVRELLIPGVHYIVPGERDAEKIRKAAAEGKVGISKAGAEMLLQIFRYVAKVEYSVDYGDPLNDASPAVTVRATCTVYADNFDGPVMGVGVGACSSWEVKYRWRNAARTCPKCGKPALIYSKEAKGGSFKGKPAFWCAPFRDGCSENFAGDDPAITGQELGKVANADPLDQLNTYVKMAAKRARVDGAIAATGSSDVFTQDLEDLPAEHAKREGETRETLDGMGYTGDPDAWREGSAKPAPAAVAPEQAPAGAIRDTAKNREIMIARITGYAREVEGLQRGRVVLGNEDGVINVCGAREIEALGMPRGSYAILDELSVEQLLTLGIFLKDELTAAKSGALATGVPK